MEIAMPQKTLADILAARESVYVNCAHPVCCKSTKLDVQALIDRLGPDHGSMHQDLVGLFACSDCKAANRDRRPMFFTVVPDYDGINAKSDRDWKPTFGR
ncbi:hypothetical protein NKI36_06480 [Mesorhizobium caraganae]|uniref:Uncharacterized protein n=1 Tax=Mesorhizobium caraganae TaxID=483206 RepID=A0ABV1YVN1_9HYPH